VRSLGDGKRSGDLASPAASGCRRQAGERRWAGSDRFLSLWTCAGLERSLPEAGIIGIPRPVQRMPATHQLPWHAFSARGFSAASERRPPHFHNRASWHAWDTYTHSGALNHPEAPPRQPHRPCAAPAGAGLTRALIDRRPRFAPPSLLAPTIFRAPSPSRSCVGQPLANPPQTR